MTTAITRAVALGSAAGMTLAGALVLAPSAYAKDGDVRLRSACTAPSTSTLAVKVRAKDGQLRTDFWVKTAAAGQSWAFTLTQDGSLVASSTGTTSQDDDSGDGSRSTGRVALRDRGSDDHGGRGSDDDPLTHDVNDDHGGRGSDDDPLTHDVIEDHGGRGSGDSNDDVPGSSSGSGSLSRPAEVKFRSWIPNVAGDLVFTATFAGETCTVTVPRPA